MATIELVIFFIGFVLFFYQSWKKNKQVDKKSCFLTVMFFLAFCLHYSYLCYAYAGPEHCRAMHVATSFVFFTPQAIFFLIFIWTIFKLLVIWRGMVAQSDKDAHKERKRIDIIRWTYLILWAILWVTQRTCEAVTINNKMDNWDKPVNEALKATLFTSNILELVIELFLYAALVKVSMNFNKFLQEYEQTSGPNSEEYKTIKQGRTVFLVVTITIFILMLTDSVYSATSPFLWLSDVYAENHAIEITFSTATTLFFATNTFFTCLMLYVIFVFYLEEKDGSGEERKKRLSQAMLDETRGSSQHVGWVHTSRYLRNSEGSFYSNAYAADHSSSKGADPPRKQSLRDILKGSTRERTNSDTFDVSKDLTLD